jgi:hypothetical protein
MIRTNLSTRPFYNERAVHAVLALLAILVLALTTFNVYRIVTLSRRNTELSSTITQDEREAEALRAEARKIRAGINQAELKTVVAAAQEANTLIDQRTFSWTAFFNRIEDTLPPDVMLVAVRPGIDEGVTTIVMTVLGRRAEDIDEFMEKLEATGAFEDVLPQQEDRTEEGLHRVTLQAFYTGAAEDAAAQAPAPGTPTTEPEAASQPPTKPGGER